MECDSVLISSSAAYESVPLETLKGWFSSLNKPVYALGPLLPLDYGCDEAKFEAHGDIGSFLARMQEKYGEHSLLFVRTFLLSFRAMRIDGCLDISWDIILDYKPGVH